MSQNQNLPVPSEWLTHCEQTDYRETPRYDATIDYCKRLAEASRELGLALPVYVVFTKMDRIPHFESWIGSFTKDELRAPLGATLPFDAASTIGSYAERLAPRLDAAFQQIIDGIAARRTDLLSRENAQERR